MRNTYKGDDEHGAEDEHEDEEQDEGNYRGVPLGRLVAPHRRKSTYVILENVPRTPKPSPNQETSESFVQSFVLPVVNGTKP